MGPSALFGVRHNFQRTCLIAVHWPRFQVETENPDLLIFREMDYVTRCHDHGSAQNDSALRRVQPLPGGFVKSSSCP